VVRWLRRRRAPPRGRSTPLHLARKPARPWRSALLAAFLVAFAALIAACGSDDDDGDDDAATPTATAEAPAEPSDTPAGDDGSVRLAQDGDRVSVHYHGTLEDGEVFDSSRERAPLQFTVGAGAVIDGFDDAVRGLAEGESVTVTLPPAQAYGEHREDLILDVPSEGAPDSLSVGDQVRLGNGQPAVVLEITDLFIKVDANHRLAGKTLTFEIELVSIE
jgi:FKBP-type peptidyl-prolyl cis-trans isomerase 2